MRQNATKRARKLGVGVSIADLAEESKFGRNARRDLRRWFPGIRWIRLLDEQPQARELYVMDRRRFLWTMGLTVAAPAVLLPTAACSEAVAQLLFIAVEMAAKYYLGSSADGSAIFSSSSPSRETFQLLSKLVQGTPEAGGKLQDQDEYEVSVPANDDHYAYAFKGLSSGKTGDHFVQGVAQGETKDSNVFQYEDQ